MLLRSLYLYNQNNTLMFHFLAAKFIDNHNFHVCVWQTCVSWEHCWWCKTCSKHHIGILGTAHGWPQCEHKCLSSLWMFCCSHCTPILQWNSCSSSKRSTTPDLKKRLHTVLLQTNKCCKQFMDEHLAYAPWHVSGLKIFCHKLHIATLGCRFYQQLW